jgi:hypothetical protein
VRAARARHAANNCAGVDSIAAVLSGRRERMSKFENASLDLYVAQCRADRMGTLNAARIMESVAPRSDFVQAEVINAAAAAGAYEEVVSRVEKLDVSRGWFAATPSAIANVTRAAVSISGTPQARRPERPAGAVDGQQSGGAQLRVACAHVWCGTGRPMQAAGGHA